ncbi:MAG: hypothetical protein JNK10_06305 [Cyclobacteriaceae bacterium]|nr:hypothetical protein [Cyclobacteriaceae bacterium]
MAKSVYAQPRPIGLTDEMRAKVESISSPEKKLIRYKKFIHKDSIRFLKEASKYWRRKSDSLIAVLEGTVEKWEHKQRKFLDRLNKRIANPQTALIAKVKSSSDSIDLPKLSGIDIDSLQAKGVRSPDIPTINKDSTLGPGIIPDIKPTATDGRLESPKIEIPQVADPTEGVKAKLSKEFQQHAGNNQILKGANGVRSDITQYTSDVEKYKQYSSLSKDSLRQLAALRAKNEAEGQLMALSGLKDSKTHLKQLEEFRSIQSQYNEQFGKLNDPKALKEKGKQQAEEAAMKYLAENPAPLQQAQTQIDRLMKKYSIVPNSNDLTTAVKRTSLEGRPLRERLVIALNIQVPSYDPVTIDFSPQLGYKINSRFILGVGGTYRKTFSDATTSFAPEVAGYKTFSSYDVFKSFFVYGEYANNTTGKKSDGSSNLTWQPAAWLGVGKRFSVHKKVDMTVLAIYNVIHKPNDPIYPQPFVVRVGFQLSELALFKKKPEMLKW